MSGMHMKKEKKCTEHTASKVKVLKYNSIFKIETLTYIVGQSIPKSKHLTCPVNKYRLKQTKIW